MKNILLRGLSVSVFVLSLYPRISVSVAYTVGLSRSLVGWKGFTIPRSSILTRRRRSIVEQSVTTNSDSNNKQSETNVKNYDIQQTATTSTTSLEAVSGDKKSATTVRFTRIFNSINKYNLIWSEGMWQRTILACCIVFAIHSYFLSYFKAHNLALDWRNMDSIAPKYVHHTCTVGVNFALPILAGACCFIQICINMIAGGCAGFNTVFGPFRPFSVALLAYLTYVRYSDASVRTHILRWIVALLPEIVHVWNTYQSSKYTSMKTFDHVLEMFRGNKSDTAVKQRTMGSNNIHQALGFKVTVQLGVPTMGCVACINKIDEALKKALSSEKILHVSSELKNSMESGGDAVVCFYTKSDKDVDGKVQALIQGVDQAGFGDKVSIKSLTLEKIDELGNGS